MNADILVEVLSRNKFEDLSVRLLKLDKEQRSLFIGILGEFNAGKSTLVNALMGRKLLPAMDRPTTARITEIFPESGRESLSFYLRNTQGQLREVSVLDFDGALLTTGDEVAIIKAPSNELLKDGYCIVDTPGLSSLDKIHADITFGYLPMLDGSVICHDINKGGLTASLRAFLSKREIQPLFGRILFVLTRSDTKTAASADILKQSFTLELANLAEELGVNVPTMDTRVISLSPLRMLEAGEGKESVVEAMDRVFVKPRAEMLKERIEKETGNIIQQTINRLHDKRENLRLDRTQYAGRRGSLIAEIERLEAEHRELDRTVDALAPDLRRIINRHTEELGVQIQQEQMRNGDLVTTFKESLEAEINALTLKRLKLGMDFSVNASGDSLESQLKRNAARVEVGKYAGNAVMVGLIAYATGGVGSDVSGALMNAGQAVVEDIVEGAGGAMIVHSVKGSQLGRTIAAINPVEHAANYLGNFLKSKIITEETGRIADSITQDVLQHLKEIARTELFEPKLTACKAARKHLDSLIAEEKADAAQIQQQRDLVEEDILQLT